MSYTIRRATPEDKPEWIRMCQRLWPDAPVEYLDKDLDNLLADSDAGILVAPFDKRSIQDGETPPLRNGI